MSILRGEDRPVLERGPGLPTLQRLVDRANGSDSITVLINHFTRGETVPAHTHHVEDSAAGLVSLIGIDSSVTNVPVLSWSGEKKMRSAFSTSVVAR